MPETIDAMLCEPWLIGTAANDIQIALGRVYTDGIAPVSNGVNPWRASKCLFSVKTA